MLGFCNHLFVDGFGGMGDALVCEKCGAGVYACRLCKRATRGSGGDSADVRLCDQCYELAGYENMVSDGHKLSKGDVAAIKRKAAEIKSLGGNATRWADLVVTAMPQEI